ncbi:MAG: sugar phosphate nucleotidyltransferase, partial [Elusimicrobiota bacterium]|nr:sugar phosphate nucleotidyltransferase [Elusimicrobiota bacterium]
IGARGGDIVGDKKPRAGRFPVSAPGKSLLQAAVVRGVKLAGAENVFIVSNEEYRFLLRDHLKEGGMDFPLENILAEPVGKNTLAAIALGVRALEARDEKKEVAATQGEGIASAKKGRPKAAVTAEGISLNGGREVLAQGAAGADNDDASIFVFPADHLIKDEAKFIAALKKAEAAAGEEYITALGIKPYRAETGYGYIKAGGKLRCNKSRKSTPGTKVETMVEKFVEKPSEAKAEKFLKSGNYFWNAGIFVASASVFRAEFEKNSPALWRSFQKWDGKDFKKLGGFYKKLPSVSFDCAVMEKTKKAAVVVYDGRWNDLGGWDSVYEVTKKDKNGNALGGDVISLDSENNLVYSTTGKAVSLIGVKDLRIAQTDDALLIMAEGRSQEVKRVVEKLKGREELVNHIRVRRPWGSFKTLERADNYKIKVIEMLPGRSLSLQKHRRRSEEWLVLTGNVEVELNGKIHKLKENGRIKIPKGASHRLTNNCRKTAKILEIAHGSYIEEDDIIRLEDDFGRV